MEKKFVKAPFDLELAKKIASGEKEGKIVTRKGYPVQILSFDMANRDYPICAKVLVSTDEDCYHFAANGAHYKEFNPESDVDLMMEIPEENDFKDGDILVFNEKNIGVLESIIDNKVNFHAILWGERTTVNTIYTNTTLRYATEKERQEILNRMENDSNPIGKSFAKRFSGIENTPELSIENKCEFKPFDKVLVRDNDDDDWRPDFFWGKQSVFTTIGGCSWNQCIPYNEQTAHLIDTSENPEPVIPFTVADGMKTEQTDTK